MAFLNSFFLLNKVNSSDDCLSELVHCFFRYLIVVVPGNDVNKPFDTDSFSIESLKMNSDRQERQKREVSAF